MINYTIRQAQTGWQYLDKGLYGTYGKGYGEIIEPPVFCWLLEGGGRKSLVDTGMSDTEHSVKYHHDGKQEPGQAIQEQLAKLGIGVEEIEIIIFTHPYKEKGWPFTPPGRFYNIVEIWHSIEEVLRRSDHILMTHDPKSSDMALFP